MKNENLHAYSWAAQQRRARRDFVIAYASAIACILGTVGMVVWFVVLLSA